MIFKVIINENAEENITATVHRRSSLIDQIEALISEDGGTNRIPCYTDDDMVRLPISDISCITVLDGKTYVIDAKGKRYRSRQRLYEIEELLPDYFIRINKSAIANEIHLERFHATFSGAVDAVFKCGYTEYVSRRCFAAIKRRFDKV